MKTSTHLAFRRGDMLAILLVAFLAVCIFATFALHSKPEQSGLLQIYQDGRLIRELTLQADDSFQITGDYVNTITIQGGRAAITASDCPGGDCVHSGWIEGAGRSIVCLPNRVELRIAGASADVDFAVR